MYRQQQLEEAVKEARLVNQQIEEERQKMKELKNRLRENNLSQYVNITAHESKLVAASKIEEEIEDSPLVEKKTIKEKKKTKKND